MMMPQSETGYLGTGPKNRGLYVAGDDALCYALANCGIRALDTTAPDCAELLTMLPGWYFSGAWLPGSDPRQAQQQS